MVRDAKRFEVSVLYGQAVIGDFFVEPFPMTVLAANCFFAICVKSIHYDARLTFYQMHFCANNTMGEYR